MGEHVRVEPRGIRDVAASREREREINGLAASPGEECEHDSENGTFAWECMGCGRLRKDDRAGVASPSEEGWIQLAREKYASIGGATRPIPGMEDQFWQEWSECLAWAMDFYKQHTAALSALRTTKEGEGTPALAKREGKDGT